MAGMPLAFANNNAGTYTIFGLFFKLASLPTVNTVLFEAKNGLVARLRLSIQSSTDLMCDYLCDGDSASLIVNPVLDPVPGGWHYVSCTAGGGRSGITIIGQMTGPGGATDGLQSTTIAGGTFDDIVDCSVGWGVDLSGTMDSFPNSAGNEMAVLSIGTGKDTVRHVDDEGVFAVPTADPPTTGLTALYLCHQPLGPAGTISDSTSNHYDLTAGPNLARIVADGPY